MSESWRQHAVPPAHATPGNDDDAERAPVKRERSGRGGIMFLLFLLLLALIGGALFYVLEYGPLKARHTTATARVAEVETRLDELEGQLEAVTAERDTLRAERDALAAEKSALASKVAESEALIAELTKAQEALQATFGSEIKAGEVEIRGGKGTLSVDLKDRILFPSGEATLSDKGKGVLRRVAQELVRLEGRAIQVGGHSDNQPLSKALKERFPTNWELSTARATNVVRFLTDECGLPPERLVAAGFSQYRPVGNNRSNKGRARNRRIELQVVPMP